MNPASNVRLTFAIITQIPNFHPGVIEIAEETPRGKRPLPIPRLLASQLVREGKAVSLALAEALYLGLTSRRRGTQKGPRCDFKAGVIIHLVQQNGKSQRPRFDKRSIGDAEIPGGIPSQDICRLIAGALEHGLFLPKEAYQLPEQTPSGSGAALYDALGFRFEHAVRFEHNHRLLEGPIVFMAFVAGTQGISHFATLHQGHAPDGQIFPFYRLFAFEYPNCFSANEAPVKLLDRGAHPLEVLIRLNDPAGFMPNFLTYWSRYPQVLEVWGAPMEGQPPLELLQSYLTLVEVSTSLYCDSCERLFHDLPPQPGAEGAMFLCPHCWWCQPCGRWSSPTERDGRFNWEGVCQHAGPERSVAGRGELRVSGPQLDQVRNAPEQELEKGSFPRLYFSTRSHLYALIYQRRGIGHVDNPFVEVPIYSLEFPSALRELPFTGDSWLDVIEAIEEEDARAALLHLSPSYHHRLGHFTRKTHEAAPLDVNCVVLLRPSHTTPDIARLLERDGQLWYQAALYKHEYEQGPPPPEPSLIPQHGQDGEALFDVFARGRVLGSLHARVRLPFQEALQVGRDLAERERGVLLRYNETEDTLEWLAPQEARADEKLIVSGSSEPA